MLVTLNKNNCKTKRVRPKMDMYGMWARLLSRICPLLKLETTIGRTSLWLLESTSSDGIMGINRQYFDEMFGRNHPRRHST